MNQKLAILCNVEGCSAPKHTRTWCRKHYRRWLKCGDTEPHERPSPSRCSVADCHKTATARGWCATHYARWQRKGTALREPPAMRHKRPEYKIWIGMRARCGNPQDTNYVNYGGRGIKVCQRWLKGEDGEHPFDCFLADMGNRPDQKHSIDRIDNDGNYSPDNCRWATQTVQHNNTRGNRVITFDNRTMTLVRWCSLLGVPYMCVIQRLDRGWGFVKAVTTGYKRNQYH